MRRLELEIPVILYNLERIFPPSFFDLMEHLPVHLPHEARIAGPVQFRWMYPFERYCDAPNPRCPLTTRQPAETLVNVA